MAENKAQQAAEERLRGYAEKLGISFKDFYHLLNTAYVDDENIRKRQAQARAGTMELMQMQLQELQYRNEMLSNQLLTYDLEKKVKRMNMKNKFKAFFNKKSPKPQSK